MDQHDTARATSRNDTDAAPTLVQPVPCAREQEALAVRRRAAGLGDDAATPTVGLALSGGGIRSATFCLGLLRGLAQRGVLRRFDYLSTVSGGGYIGAMYGKLVAQLGPDEAQEVLARSDSRSLAWLRRYGRYLAPRGARDYGMGIATYLRAIVAVHLEFAFLALALGLVAIGVHALHAQHGLFLVEGWSAWPSAWWPIAVGAWLLLAPGLLGVYWMLRDPRDVDGPPRRARFRPWDTAVVLGAGVAGAMLVWNALQPMPWPLPAPGWTLLAGVVLLSLGGVGVVVLAALLPRAPGDARTVIANARRRMTGALRWTNVLFAGLVLLGAIDWASWHVREWVERAPAGLFGGLGAGGLLLLALRALNDPMQAWMKGAAGDGGRVLPMLVNVLGFVLALLLVVAWTTLAQWLVFDGTTLGACPAWMPGAVCAPLAPDALGTFDRWLLCALALVVWFVATGSNAESANTTSLHNMYAARLVRAYLGAANRARLGGDFHASAAGTTPEAASDVTEVHGDDDVPLDAYDPSGKGGPIHLVNVCLNQTRGHRSGLYNADRKGVPLVVSRFGLQVGEHRITAPGAQRLGTLGRWVAISGAAASPGAGSHTTPGWAALLFLAGARLGWWLDLGRAPRLPGDDARTAHPWRTRLVDALGATKMGRLLAECRAAYPGPLARNWYLSDGGHFDNTGVHPLLQRQLDFILLADCGADPQYRYADLENLVRKARIDFGAEIEFYTAEDAHAQFFAGHASAEEDGHVPLAVLSPEMLVDNTTARGVLLARILYRADDSGHRRVGTLLVVKPALHQSLDVDLLAYARRNPVFPQQGTGDQFFDEAQWESYHRLGEDVGAQVRDAWLARLPGWQSRLDVASPERIRACHLATPDAASGARVFWKVNAKDAAVGALSLGALVAFVGPLWQAIDAWRAERAEAREALATGVDDVEKALARAGQDATRPFPRSTLLWVVRLQALSEQFDPNAPEAAAARDLLAEISTRCTPGAPAPLPGNVCQQLAGGTWLQARVISPYWQPGANDDPDAAVPVAVDTGTEVGATITAMSKDAPTWNAPGAGATPEERTDAEPASPEPSAGTAPPVLASTPPPMFESAPAPALPQDCAGRKVRVFAHVFDEASRGTLDAFAWNGLRPVVALQGVENVAMTAAARGTRVPNAHPVPTLVWHQADDAPCAQALGQWVAGQAGLDAAQQVRVRPLPKGFRGQRGVIELWWPPARDAAAR